MKNEVIYNVLDKLIKLGFVFLMSVLTARLLSKNDFGSYIYISVILSSCLVIIGGGVDTIFSKKISSKQSIDVNILLGYLLIRAGMSVFLSIMIALYFFINNLYEEGIIFIVFISCSIFLFCISEQTCIALFKNKMMLQITLSTAFIFLAMKISFIYFLRDFTWKIFADSIENLIVFIITIWMLRSKIKSVFSVKKILFHTKFFVKKAFPLWLNTVLLIIYSRMDQVYVASIGGHGDIADYGIAINLNTIALIIPTALMTVYFPKMIEAFNSDRDKYESMICQLIRLSVLYGFSWSLFCFLFGEFAIEVIYGVRYVEASNYLQIISLSSTFVILGQIFGQHMVIRSQYWVSFKRSFIGIALTIFIYFVLNDSLNINGVAIITVLNAITVNLLLYLLLPETKDIMLFVKSSIRRN